MPLSNVHHVYWQSDRDGSKVNNLMQKFYSHNQTYLASYIFNTISILLIHSNKLKSANLLSK